MQASHVGLKPILSFSRMRWVLCGYLKLLRLPQMPKETTWIPSGQAVSPVSYVEAQPK